tara:strand:- start:578 stop:1072 length:495 start_codon:yes stop_codon:yes gene_type:complete
MNWFDILKNLKGKAKGKGSTLDASKIKVNIQDDECKKKVRELIDSPLSEGYIEEGPFSRMPEKVACEFLKELREIDDDIMGSFPQDLYEKYGDKEKARNFMGYTIVWDVSISSPKSTNPSLIGYCEIKGKEVFAMSVKALGPLDHPETRSEYYLETYQEWRKLL